MSKHTPGPWKAGRPDMGTLVDGVESKWIYAGGKYVAVASGRVSDDWFEIMANARLIAAAPELLDALKLCAAVCAGETMHKDGLIKALDTALAAIAKAEGTDLRPIAAKETGTDGNSI